MALKLGELFFDFNADTSKLKRKQKEIVTTNDKVVKSFKRVGTAIVAAFSIDLLRRAALTADQMRLLDVRIKNVTKSQKDFNRAQQELLRISNQTGTALASNVRLFEAFTIAGNELGATNDQVLSLTENINKLGIIGGSSQEALGNATLQLGQALAGGIVRAEEFNSIVENTPLIAKAIADGLGVSIGQLRKMVLAGELLSEDVFNVILKQTDKINEKFGTMPITMERAWTEFSNNLGQTIKDLNEVSGLTSTIAGIIESWSAKLKSFNKQSINTTEILDKEKKIRELIGRTSGVRGRNVKIASKEASEVNQLLLKNIKLEERLTQVQNMRGQGSRNKTRNLINIKKTIENNNKRIELLKTESKAAQKVFDLRTGITSLQQEPEVKDTPPVEPSKTVKGTGLPQIPGVSGADKIRGAMGNESQVIFNALRDRTKKILELTGIGEEQRRDLLVESAELTRRQLDGIENSRQEMALNSVSQFNDSFLAVLKAAGKDQTALGKAFFLANKGIQVAQIIASSQVGAAQALALGPAGIPLASLIETLGFASAGLVAGLGVAQAFGGGRQSGGRAFAGFAHPINESGDPEIFQQGAKNFLLPGNKSGDVVPLKSADNGGMPSITINNNAPGVDVSVGSVSRGEVEIMVQRAEDKAVNRVDGSLARGQGSTFRALNKGVKTERNIR